MKKHVNFDNGDRYFGEVNAEGLPHGQGKMDYNLNGYYGDYEGEWRDGKRCGKGRFYRLVKGTCERLEVGGGNLRGTLSDLE